MNKVLNFSQIEEEDDFESDAGARYHKFEETEDIEYEPIGFKDETNEIECLQLPD